MENGYRRNRHQDGVRLWSRYQHAGWVEPTGRANARPMINSAIPIIVQDNAMGFAKGSTHPAI
jgi:hypothetical protein